jgi:hypothetical protein
MATVAQQQEQAANWRDLEWLDNGIEFALKFCTIIAEVILLIGVGYAGYKLAHRGPSNEALDQVWIISQILALDLSAPGLFAMARQARENDQQERAAWARRIAIILIVMSILSMVEGAAEYYLPGMSKDFIIWASFLMVVARCGAAVGYSVFRRLHKAERPGQVAIQPVQPPIHSGQDERMEEVQRQIAELATVVTQINVSMSNLAQPGQPYTETWTDVHPVQVKIDTPFTPVQTLTLLTQTGEDAHVAEDEQSVSEDGPHPDEPISSDVTQVDESTPEEDTAIVYPCIPGISEDVVKQIIDLHVEGVAWSAIATKLSKNYTRIVKPVKEAYTQANRERVLDRQPVHLDIYRQAVR